MRDSNSVLITAWVPGNHGAGGSTVANALGIALQHFTNKRTLIVNCGSTKSYMERYLEHDVDIRFSMDYLISFGDSITADHINTYATPINEMLYIIPNCKISPEISRADNRFSRRFIDEALKAFEIVILDIESGIGRDKQSFLERADIILAVMTENEIMLDDLYGSNGNPMIKKYLNDDRTLRIFNMLDAQVDLESELRHMNKRYGLKSSFGIRYDIEVQKACCTDRKFYSFMKSKLSTKRSKAGFTEQIKDLCTYIAEKLYLTMESQKEGHKLMNTLFTKAKKWGEADA